MIPNIKKTTLKIDESDRENKEDKGDLLKHNIKIVFIYCLILAIAFGLNDLMLNIFNKLSGYNPIILFQIIYLIILILLIVGITYFFNIKIGF